MKVFLGTTAWENLDSSPDFQKCRSYMADYFIRIRQYLEGSQSTDLFAHSTSRPLFSQRFNILSLRDIKIRKFLSICFADGLGSITELRCCLDFFPT
jgi:hypothetical protein